MDCSSSSAPDYYGFLDRMRRPAAADLICSIKSFIVSFSLDATNAEEDSKIVQQFLLTMECTIKDHPLWLNASFEEIDNAIEGLEKFIMTKLFNRTFASSPKDSKIDSDILEKIRLLQCFIKPNHLDVPRLLHNEASWLPGDYHRVHSQVDWNVLRRRHFSGRLFPQNERAVQTIRNLYIANERVVLEGEWKEGFIALAAIGATNVGSN